MYHLVLSLLLPFATTAGVTSPEAATYKTAYKASIAQGKPLVVLVGADWCPGCQTMKRKVLPQLQAKGALTGVELAVVDSDAESKLAGQLMSGNSIPQLIMYYKTSKGWKRQQMTGAHSEEEVRAFIAEGVTHTVVARKDSAPAK